MYVSLYSHFTFDNQSTYKLALGPWIQTFYGYDKTPLHSKYATGQ